MSALNIERLSQADRPAGNLVFVHGWGIGKAVWHASCERLAAHYPVHCVDLPGYGNSAPDADFMASAHALAAALPDECVLCGWSLGGMLALQAALIAPQCIKRLILVGTSPSFTQRGDWPDAQPLELLSTFSSAVADDAATTLQRFIALLNQGDSQGRALGRMLNRQLKEGTLPDTATLLSGLNWLRDVDLRQQLGALNIPTLLIHGENDPLMPLAAARWLHERLPAAQLEVFPGAAHAPFLNDPERFAKLIGDHCHAPAFH